MKRCKLKKVLKKFLLIITILILLIILFSLLQKIDDSFIKACTKAGYSEEYCLMHK